MQLWIAAAAALLGGMILAATLVSSLAVWFAAGAGFWAGLVVGLIVLGAGTFALRHGWAHSSEAESLDYPQARSPS